MRKNGSGRRRRRADKEIKFKDGVPDDSELIVSPGRQIFNRFMERKFAVFSVFVVLVMFCGGLHRPALHAQVL